MKHLLLFASILLFGTASAQVPNLSQIMGQTSICSDPAAPQSFSVMATNSPTFYNWSVSPSAGVVIYGSSSVVTISFPNTANVFYTIQCYASNAFGSSASVFKGVQVYETPTVTFSGATIICQGSSTNLSASPTIRGASSSLSYSWSPSIGLNTTTGPDVIATPPHSMSYAVLLTLGGCTNTEYVTVIVDSTCFVGIKSISRDADNSMLAAYPNPNNGEFILKTSKKETITISTDLGQVIQTVSALPGEETKISGLPGGIYFIATPTSRRKIIVTKN